MESYLNSLQPYIERSQQRREALQHQLDQIIASKAAKTQKNNMRSVSSFSGGPSPATPNVPKNGKISLGELVNRIANKESGGNYSAKGSPVDNGDYAVGKYQIMASNVPSWTQTYLGHSLTPQQFLNRHKAQDRVAEEKLKYYYKRYGAGGAAAAWYGGESVAQDWQKYKQGYYYNSTGSTRYPSIFEYVKDILRG